MFKSFTESRFEANAFFGLSQGLMCQRSLRLLKLKGSSFFIPSHTEFISGRPRNLRLGCRLGTVRPSFDVYAAAEQSFDAFLFAAHFNAI
jgi:hypothetical protein